MPKSEIDIILEDLKQVIEHMKKDLSSAFKTGKSKSSKKRGGMAAVEDVPPQVYNTGNLIGNVKGPETIVGSGESLFLGQVSRPNFADSLLSMGGIDNISAATRNNLLPALGAGAGFPAQAGGAKKSTKKPKKSQPAKKK